MRLSSALALALTALLSFGCSKRYDVEFPFDKTNAVGTWVLKSAPSAALSTLGTNAQLSRIILRGDGMVEYRAFPFQAVLDLSVIRSTASHWKVISGTNIWLFGNEHYGRRNVWTIMLETDERGVELDVGRSRSGDEMLVYKPDAKSDDEPVLFQRVKSGSDK